MHHAKEQPEILIGDINRDHDTQPVENLDGVLLRAYMDDMYDSGLYVTPTEINLGAVAGSDPVVVEVWNSNRYDSIVIDSMSTDDQVTVAGPGMPLTLPPLGRALYTIRVEPYGPLILDTTVSWTSGGRDTSTRIKGTRAKPFLFAHNWASSYRVTYEFKTEIISSRSGKQQRIALRATPRKTISFTSMVSGDKMREANTLLRSWQHLPFVLPELTAFTSTGYVAAGASVVDVDSVPFWLVPGASVVVQNTGYTHLSTVADVTPAGVQLMTPVPEAFPAGSKLMLGVMGRLSPQITAATVTNNVASIPMQFEQEPATVERTPGTPFPVMNGRELFLKKPNWAAPVNVSFGHEYDRLDFDRGPVTFFMPVSFGQETRQATYLARTRDEVDEIVAFFNRMKGQQGEFYAPTWQPDIVISRPSTANEYGLTVDGTEFAGAYGGSTVYRSLFVQFNDGEVITRKVESVSLAPGGVSVIQTAEPWGRRISMDDVAMIGWAPAWRFAGDILTVEWITDSVAQIQMTFTTVEDL